MKIIMVVTSRQEGYATAPPVCVSCCYEWLFFSALRSVVLLALPPGDQSITIITIAPRWWVTGPESGKNSSLEGQKLSCEK